MPHEYLDLYIYFIFVGSGKEKTNLVYLVFFFSVNHLVYLTVEHNDLAKTPPSILLFVISLRMCCAVSHYRKRLFFFLSLFL